MFQGTGSDVGKSTLVAGLCRAAIRRGINVAPFKPQNMSNNAAACSSGGEIGRSQALQALACGLEPRTDFNPVLLKPQSDQMAQVVVKGMAIDNVSARNYMQGKRAELKDAVLNSFYELKKEFDLVLVEGAGSPAEINLRQHDIANMGFARAAKVPVCLIGDIDRGGVIAAIAGTQSVIDTDDASLIKSFVINRFRGDITLFDDGLKAIETITGWPNRGVLPWLDAALRLPQEDAVVLDNWRGTTDQRNEETIHIAVPMLSRIANFDDLDPLRAEPDVKVTFVPPGSVIPTDVDAIVIPGTKSTIADFHFLCDQGWNHDIIAAARQGKRVTGLCGGYQILGTSINDESGLEGRRLIVDGLGLLDIQTRMQASKHVGTTEAMCTRSKQAVQGYEIHIGETEGPDTRTPFLTNYSNSRQKQNRCDGAINPAGNVEGTYLHGIFNNNEFRHWWLNSLKSRQASDLDYNAFVEAQLDALADRIEEHLDVDALLHDAA